ncbi:MAG: C-type lectin domain-containing protein [Sandaracinaceae bacterium]
MFRAQICRDIGGCSTLAVACSTGGAVTADGLHCFEPDATMSDVLLARDRCDELTGETHLATIHTDAEAAAVAALGGERFIGLERTIVPLTYAWDTGEPVLGALRFASGHPTPLAGDRCTLSVAGGLWHSVSCTGSHTSVCEREMWPVFAPTPP